MKRVSPSFFLAALIGVAAPVLAQDQAAAPVTIEAQTTELTLRVGEKTTLVATVKDAQGNVVDLPVFFFSRARRSVTVDSSSGEVEALQPGTHVLLARVPTTPGGGRRGPSRAEVQITVTVPHPAVASLEFVEALPSRAYRGTMLRPDVRINDELGGVRTDITANLASSDDSVAEITALGMVKLVGSGTVTVSAMAAGVAETATFNVVDNPTASIRLEASAMAARTGDVLHFDATALDASGNAITDIPIEYSFRARTVDRDLGTASSGLITEDGRFVADLAGEYTIMASAGDVLTSTTVGITPRNVKKMVEVVGQGLVDDRKTSDLWVWTAPNGRDYAVTGTWGAEGHAYFWDITDPTDITLAASVQVDARTVNDVKVSEDGAVCIISREGASNRRNGMVLLDVSDIENQGVPLLSYYDDQLTGGVHNVFIHDKHVYALSGGQRYDVINIEDPAAPTKVGSFELDTPGHSIHDVWVIDGIAVSSNWSDGIVAVDVGGGGMGGSPSNPVKMGQYAYPSGWNHAGWPHRSKSTGKFYIFAGDEHFPTDRNPQGIDRFSGPAVNAAGWIHIIDFDDMENPREVARYQVPEGGTHNFWIEDDVLYVAYYNQGLRVVDISGELLGNLYTQGREIAYFLPDDPDGFKANAARTWGTMPFKGHIWVADNNSGLWAIKLIDIPGSR